MVNVPTWYFWFNLALNGVAGLSCLVLLALNEYPRKQERVALNDGLMLGYCIAMNALWLYWYSLS